MSEAAALTAALEDDGLARRVERCLALGFPHVVLHGSIFARSGRSITPVGSQGVELSRQDCRALLAALGGALVLWTDGFHPGQEPSEWFSLICTKFRPLESLTASVRHEIRRGLRECEVRRISAETLAGEGYPVFCAAWKGYGYATLPITEEGFRSGVLREAAYPDLLHNWGVYVNERLVAYVQNQVHGTLAVYYSVGKLDPAYLHLRVSYALFHTMNEYYLKTMGFNYVSAGARSISHDTNIQNFLMQKFGFEKAYTRLRVHYRWPLGWLVWMLYPFRVRIGHAHDALWTLLELERCRRACRDQERAVKGDSPRH